MEKRKESSPMPGAGTLLLREGAGDSRTPGHPFSTCSEGSGLLATWLSLDPSPRGNPDSRLPFGSANNLTANHFFCSS